MSLTNRLLKLTINHHNLYREEGVKNRNILKKIVIIFLINPTILYVDSTLASSSQDGFAVMVSPAEISPGMTLRVIISSEREILEKDLEVNLEGPDGRQEGMNRIKKGGGPPFWQWRQQKIETPGRYRLEVKIDRKIVYSRQIETASIVRKSPQSSVFWKPEKSWTRVEENLYSAWIEALFHGAGENDSWPALHSLLSDPQRNFLHNHLGLSEDEGQLSLEPDCADNPFFLRAYFSWKNRLPFGFHECSRGSLDQAPVCGQWLSNDLPAGQGNEIKKFARVMRLVMNTVHSGTARTQLASEDSDYYPLPLERNHLRPGVVYADPYGHTLTLVRWVPQTDDRPGELLAVDAQPDGTVGLKRFWKGNFLFVTENVVGQPGFKAFRPIGIRGGKLRLLTNREIQENRDYGNFSLEQLNLQSEEFYERMERLISPEPLDPETAFRELYRALHEQLLVRVESIAVGERFMREHPGCIIPMPSDQAVFLTSGPWEDYSTPNRDLRLLIAMDTIEEYPEKVLKHPERYKMRKSESLEKIKARLETLSAKLAKELSITYVRTDGRPCTLTLEQIFRRKEALEMAYNPNDCVEIRWGAPEGSEELSACSRRAPQAQREKMQRLRSSFKKRLHPPT
jgi:hypothetical protein